MNEIGNITYSDKVSRIAESDRVAEVELSWVIERFASGDMGEADCEARCEAPHIVGLYETDCFGPLCVMMLDEAGETLVMRADESPM